MRKRPIPFGLSTAMITKRRGAYATRRFPGESRLSSLRPMVSVQRTRGPCLIRRRSGLEPLLSIARRERSVISSAIVMMIARNAVKTIVARNAVMMTVAARKKIAGAQNLAQNAMMDIPREAVDVKQQKNQDAEEENHVTVDRNLADPISQVAAAAATNAVIKATVVVHVTVALSARIPTAHARIQIANPTSSTRL